MDQTKTLKIEVPEGYEIDKEKSTFENIVFKKIENEFSRNWEEFYKKFPKYENECYIDDLGHIVSIANIPRIPGGVDKHVFPSRYGEAFVALMQLLLIREKEYIPKGWKPEKYSDNLYCICVDFTTDEIIKGTYPYIHHVLSFPTIELGDEFFKNWESLIEIAKPLL